MRSTGPEQAPGPRSSAGAPGAEASHWMAHVRLRQLVAAEAEAWRSFSKVGIAMVTGFGLVPLGTWISGSSIISHARPAESPLRSIGFLLEGVGGMTLLISLIPFAVCFARWVGAIWQRRRFSSSAR